MNTALASKAHTRGANARIAMAKTHFAGHVRPFSVAHHHGHRLAARPSALVVRAERGSGPGFWSGFIVGGLVCGVLGYVFAPQISRAILGEDQRLRLPRFLEEEDADPEVTKQNLADKIAQLNAAIDDVSAQLKAQEPATEELAA